jgi:hypothetical protein
MEEMLSALHRSRTLPSDEEARQGNEKALPVVLKESIRRSRP